MLLCSVSARHEDESEIIILQAFVLPNRTILLAAVSRTDHVQYAI